MNSLRKAVQRMSLIGLCLLHPAARADVTTSCVFCECTGKVYEADQVSQCTNECLATLTCFTGICDALTIPGTPPTATQDGFQKNWFPNLQCYSVVLQPTIPPPKDEPNCLAWALDLPFYTWDEIDSFYGNNNDVIEPDEFDHFLFYQGYTPSSSCDHEDGKVKLAIYGKQLSNGLTEVEHIAQEYDQAGTLPGGDWWTSKEGPYKAILHRLHDIEANRPNQKGDYGSVLKCYEQTSHP